MDINFIFLLRWNENDFVLEQHFEWHKMLKLNHISWIQSDSLMTVDNIKKSRLGAIHSMDGKHVKIV